jgi:hypothetical protein
LGRDRTLAANGSIRLTDPGFLSQFSALPVGTFYGVSAGKRYVVSRIPFAQHKAWKLVAEELGGTDYISLNLYLPRSGPLVRPCEMPEQKVIDFVLGLSVQYENSP